MAKENQKARVIIIRDLETLKVLTDPLRTQILQVLSRRSLNVNQIAEKLGLSASRLYYHVNLMEKHGLICVCESRTVGNIIEKYFCTTAESYDVDPNLMKFNPQKPTDNIVQYLTDSLDTTKAEILRSLEARAFDLQWGSKPHTRRMVISRQVKPLTDEKMTYFLAKLDTLIQEYSEQPEKLLDEGKDIQDFGLTIVFYPSFYYSASEK